MKRWIKWTAGSALLLGVIVVATAAGGLYLAEQKRNRYIDIKPRPVAYTTDVQTIERGRYLYASRGCTDCHGGDATQVGTPSLGYQHPTNKAVMALAHPQPTLPGAWHDSSANPERSYTLLNKESPEFIRFVNPSDYRVAREACGSCHLEVIEATERSMMSTGAMLWGGAAER